MDMTDTLAVTSLGSHGAMTAEAALVRALDGVEGLLRQTGWSPDDEIGWSLTYGRHGVFACAEPLAGSEHRSEVRIEATTGLLPGRRKRMQRVITL